MVYAGLANVRQLNRRTLMKIQAAAIANEEIAALKRYDISALPNQTNGSFIGMLYNSGNWIIATDAGAGHSAPHVLDLSAATGFSGKVSGRLQYPAGSYGNATHQVRVNFRNDTAAGTAVGLYFRATDANNGYRLLVAPSGTDLDSTVVGQQNWVLEKLINGAVVAPRLLSISVPGIGTNAWYTIKVVAANASLKTYLDGSGQDSGTLTDGDFTDGLAAIIGWGGVHAWFDDAETVVGAVTTTWGFDTSSDFPAAWVRLGLNDLPDGTASFDDNGKLTLAAFPNTNSVNLKQATVTVSWTQGSGTANYTTTALLGSSRIGQ